VAWLRKHSAVLIGRFQPLHNGHVALLHAALAQAEQVIAVLGSAWQAPSPKNPFTWQERAELLRQALPPEDAARLRCVAVRDSYDDAQWVRAVRQAVQPLLPAHADAVVLLGHFKDASSSYLDWFAPWQRVSLPRLGPFDATPLRDLYFGAGDTAQAQAQALHAVAALVPASTLQFLQRWQQTDTYARLRREWHMLADYRRAWAAAPYPPVFVTVDALLHCRTRHGARRDWVLLVRRARAPGEGLWALPGGFIEPGETLWQSCLRELREETGMQLPEATLHAAPRRVQVFDHPERSLRGRTITHVHALDLGELPELPPITGGDDAALARWVALDEVLALEAAFFEDHSGPHTEIVNTLSVVINTAPQWWKTAAPGIRRPAPARLRGESWGWAWGGC